MWLGVVVLCSAFGGSAVAQEQTFVAAQEAYERDVRHYRNAFVAAVRQRSSVAVQSYLERLTIVLQKKVTVLQAWAASRALAENQDAAQQLFLTETDTLFRESVAARRALTQQADADALRAALTKAASVQERYDATAYRIVRRLWQRRLTMMIDDSDALLVQMHRHGDDAALVEQLATVRSALDALRTRVDALPRDGVTLTDTRVASVGDAIAAFFATDDMDALFQNILTDNHVADTEGAQ